MTRNSAGLTLPPRPGSLLDENAGSTLSANQHPVIRWLEKHMSTGQILVVGIAIMAVGMLGIAIVGSYLQFLGMVALFSFGALLTRPTQQTITAGLADKRALGTFLGFNSLALAIGGGLGNIAGGWLFDFADKTHRVMLPWIIFTSIAAVTAIALYLLLTRVSAADARIV